MVQALRGVLAAVQMAKAVVLVTVIMVLLALVVAAVALEVLHLHTLLRVVVVAA
jgi:hypothetical protein